MLFSKTKPQYFTPEYFQDKLEEIHEIIVNQYDGLYEDLIIDLKNKIKIFGFHFASLDIRQDSRVHKTVFDEIFTHPEISKYVENFPANYYELATEARYDVLTKVKGDDGTHFEAIIVSTLFEDKSIIKQHQMVYQALGDMMRQEIHALSMKTLTPEQWKNN